MSLLSLQCHWVDLFGYKELTIHLQLLSITANLSKSWTTNKDKMKDDPEPPVLPPAASSPPFEETLAKTTRESMDPKGRLIVAAVKQQECKHGMGSRCGMSGKWLQWLMMMCVVLLAACHQYNDVLIMDMLTLMSCLRHCQALLQAASWGKGEVTGQSVVGETRSLGSGQQQMKSRGARQQQATRAGRAATISNMAGGRWLCNKGSQWAAHQERMGDTNDWH